jgi:hypothetical protein
MGHCNASDIERVPDLAEKRPHFGAACNFVQSYQASEKVVRQSRLLIAIGRSYSLTWNQYRLRLTKNDVKEKAAALKEILKLAYDRRSK